MALFDSSMELRMRAHPLNVVHSVTNVEPPSVAYTPMQNPSPVNIDKTRLKSLFDKEEPTATVYIPAR